MSLLDERMKALEIKSAVKATSGVVVTLGGVALSVKAGMYVYNSVVAVSWLKIGAGIVAGIIVFSIANAIAKSLIYSSFKDMAEVELLKKSNKY